VPHTLACRYRICSDVLLLLIITCVRSDEEYFEVEWSVSSILFGDCFGWLGLNQVAVNGNDDVNVNANGRWSGLIGPCPADLETLV